VVRKKLEWLLLFLILFIVLLLVLLFLLADLLLPVHYIAACCMAGAEYNFGYS
jgi:hypothetical protein